jgi:hypothetical protein
MERLRPSPALPAMLMIIGIGSLVRFSQNLYQYSQNVRTVDIVGLSGGGAACGAALFGFIYALVNKKKT